MAEILESFMSQIDSSFKYILLGMNFMTFIVIYLHQRRKVQKKQFHVLFVTAHPDDEAMFFRPTISSLCKNYFVHLLCLSNGASPTQDKSQNPRVGQFESSLLNLQIHRGKCLSNAKLIDGLKQKWCQQTIRDEVISYVKQNQIRAVLTFDQFGISGHPNHSSIYHALKELEFSPTELKDFEERQKKRNNQSKLRIKQKDQIQQVSNESQNQPAKKSIKIYYLKSSPFYLKYNTLLQVMIGLFKTYSWISLNIITSWRAMAVYKSQFIWYRKLWTMFSSYGCVNCYRCTRINVD